jgi:serine O-acetyltransferase
VPPAPPRPARSKEAEADAAAEPLLSSFLYASILSHDNFERSLAFVLSNRLSDATFLATELFEVFYSILRGQTEISEAALADLCAVRERDPACLSYSQALLHYKGFHAIQAHRIAHELWTRGRKVMAAALQSRMSEVFAVDIHPAARFGRGILIDHGTGVVIGETAELGNNVSILQNVTLGGTGKVHGDRHPKISDNVLIGASASILVHIVLENSHCQRQPCLGTARWRRILQPDTPKTTHTHECASI